MKKFKQFLDYAATNPDAIVTYHASDMVLVGHIDASYISDPKARIRAGGHWFLSSDEQFPRNNGMVYSISTLIRVVMSFATEAKLCALFQIARPQSPHAKRWRNWAMHNQPRPCKQTTRQRMVYSRGEFYPRQPRPSTCASGGCATTSSRKCSGFTGGWGRTTMETTGRITILGRTTNWSARNI